MRQELIDFSNVMEEVLLDNDYKGGWKKINYNVLAGLLSLELSELWDAIRDGNKDQVCKEAIDVANFAMMIWDNCGGLKKCKKTTLT